MAAEDYYGDGEDMTAKGDTGPMQESPSDKEEPKETQTALIDSSICPGMEPGDEMVVKIDKVLENQYLVSYAPEPSKEEETSEMEEAPMPGPGEGSMAAMLQ